MDCVLTVNFTLPPPLPCKYLKYSILLHLLRLLRIHSTPPRVRLSRWIEGNRFPSLPPPSLPVYVICMRILCHELYQSCLSKRIGSGKWEYGESIREDWNMIFRFSLLMIRLLVFFDFFFFGIKFGFLIKLFESNNWIFILIYLFSFFFKYSWKLIGVKRDLILSCFCVNVNY